MATRFTDDRHVALRDSVTERPFGPIFDSLEHAQDFLEWLEREGPNVSPKTLGSNELERYHGLWRSERCDRDGDLKAGA